MATEIERKFLVIGDGWRAQADGGVRYRQGYLGSAPSCSIRVRVDGERAWLNIKSATVGVSRSEYEYPIPLADGERILAELCLRPIIEKVRYRLTHAGSRWEIDCFEGANAGLVVAEIELDDPDQPFERPPWLGEEVSHDPRYYNAALVEHPFSTW